jgi:hypothetical protein
MLGDRVITVIGAGGASTARLTWWMEGDDYHVAIDGPSGRHEAGAADLFGALVEIRKALEPAGWLPAVHGARRDAYPSAMARNAGGGAVYILVEGRDLGPADVVPTLGDAPPELVCTVAEQRRHFEEWRDGPRGKRRFWRRRKRRAADHP